MLSAGIILRGEMASAQAADPTIRPKIVQLRCSCGAVAAQLLLGGYEEANRVASYWLFRQRAAFLERQWRGLVS